MAGSYSMADLVGVAQPSGPQSPIAGYPAMAGAVAPSASASSSPMTAQSVPTGGNAPTVAWLAVLAAYILLRVWAETTGARLE